MFNSPIYRPFQSRFRHLQFCLFTLGLVYFCTSFFISCSLPSKGRIGWREYKYKSLSNANLCFLINIKSYERLLLLSILLPPVQLDVEVSLFLSYVRLQLSHTRYTSKYKKNDQEFMIGTYFECKS